MVAKTLIKWKGSLVIFLNGDILEELTSDQEFVVGCMF